MTGHNFKRTMVDEYSLDIPKQTIETLQRAEIKHIPEHLIHIIQNEVEPHRCYHNAYFTLLSLNGLTKQPLKYVLGYIFSANKTYLAHAWIKVGKIHFDPTRELQSANLDIPYYIYKEYNLKQLKKFVENTGYAPDFKTVDNYPP